MVKCDLQCHMISAVTWSVHVYIRRSVATYFAIIFAADKGI